MKPTNTLLTILTVALGTLGQNDSVKPLNKSLDALNFTESEALARSVTWYHLDEDDEQELCGNTDTQPTGKQDILKVDCQELVNFMKARPGYWKVNGYSQQTFVYADLITRGTCEFSATRQDALNTYFEIGNLDIVDFVEAAMRTSNDPTRMTSVTGSTSCAGDFTPLVIWSVDFPMSGVLPSVRMSTAGWAMMGISMGFFTFL